VCNPVGAIGSAALMLDHLGLDDGAKAVRRAIEVTTAAGIRTRDVGGTATTDDVTNAIIQHLTSD
jgi:tartrate dehydrogenase/decarboxylase / D-malate dehydrogenase